MCYGASGTDGGPEAEGSLVGERRLSGTGIVKCTSMEAFCSLETFFCKFSAGEILHADGADCAESAGEIVQIVQIVRARQCG